MQVMCATASIHCNVIEILRNAEIDVLNVYFIICFELNLKKMFCVITLSLAKHTPPHLQI